jgi:AraC family transcriptional regulator
MPRTLRELLPTLAALSASRDRRRSLAELASAHDTSPSTLQRAFTRIVGESPKHYTRRLQLECAALALIGTDQSVLDVALDAGFDSHEGFTRAFATHFGVPPKAFRQRHAHLRHAPLHAELLEHVGPCIGLFRAPLNHTPKKDPQMNYDITRQQLDAATFLYKRGRCAHADIATTLGQLLPAVYQHAIERGYELRSPPTTVYVEWGPGMVTLHAGMFVAAAEAADGFEVAELPAGEAAVAIHTGPYDSLGEAHAALEQFLDAHGLTPAGPVRETYLTDPGETPDPNEWKTQLAWPIA